MTKCIQESKLGDEIILEISNAIKEGKIVVFPTDTVYGIGTNALNEKACEKIYDIKGRPKYKPLSVLISDISMLKDIVLHISPIEQKLIDAFWPGPLTIKLKKNPCVLPEIISAGDEFVRVRLVDEWPISKIIQTAGCPVVAPSANMSGSETGTRIENIVKELGGKVDYILDCGDIESDAVSTIVEVNEGNINVLREGKITIEEIKARVEE